MSFIMIKSQANSAYGGGPRTSVAVAAAAATGRIQGAYSAPPPPGFAAVSRAPPVQGTEAANVSWFSELL